MMPPIARRCPSCQNVAPTRRFAVVVAHGQRLVECPACGRRFEPVDDPRLQ